MKLDIEDKEIARRWQEYLAFIHEEDDPETGLANLLNHFEDAIYPRLMSKRERA